MNLLHQFILNKPDDFYLLLWTLQDKRSEFVQTMGEAEKYIASIKDSKDCYVGVGYHATPQPPTKRGTRADIAGLPGLYADVDIKSEKRYFKSFAEAGEFLTRLPLPPTAIIHSGGGLQPWWLFKEPFIFEGEDDRARAERYTKGWLKYLVDFSGHDMDSVGDITRVLRVPGTLNFKYQPARPVEYLKSDGHFYNLSDFDEWLLPEPTAPNSPIIIENFAENLSRAAKAIEQLSPARRDDYHAWLHVGMALYSLGDMGLLLWRMWSQKSAKYQEGDCEKKWASFSTGRDSRITLGSLFYWVFEDNKKDTIESVTPDPAAQVAFDLINTLTQENKKFKLTWERKRADLDTQYKYDCSLIGFGLSNGLDNQTIANLIIYHRRRHGQNPEEACKPGYIDRLIARIKEDKKVDEEREKQMHEAQSELNNPQNDPEPVRQSLSKLFGVNITKFVRYTGDPAKYALFIDEERIVEFGQINSILNFSLFREKMASVTGTVLSKNLRLKWDQFAQSLLSIMQDLNTGAESTEIGRARAWISEYLEQAAILSEKNVENAASPFLENGLIHIIGSDFRGWLARQYGENLAQNEIGRILRKAGCAPHTQFRKVSRLRTSRTVWQIPKSLYSFTPDLEESDCQENQANNSG